MSTLDDIEARAKAATPGPLADYTWHPSAEEAAAYFREALEKNAAERLSMVYVAESMRTCRDGFDGEPLIVAMTGNGPNAVNNALFFAAAREDVPQLCTWLREALELLETVQMPVQPRRQGQSLSVGALWNQRRDALLAAVGGKP